MSSQPTSPDWILDELSQLQALLTEDVRDQLLAAPELDALLRAETPSEGVNQLILFQHNET